MESPLTNYSLDTNCPLSLLQTLTMTAADVATLQFKERVNYSVFAYYSSNVLERHLSTPQDDMSDIRHARQKYPTEGQFEKGFKDKLSFFYFLLSMLL